MGPVCADGSTVHEPGLLRCFRLCFQVFFSPKLRGMVELQSFSGETELLVNFGEVNKENKEGEHKNAPSQS